MEHLKQNGEATPQKLESSDLFRPVSTSTIRGYDKTMLEDARQYLSSGTVNETELSKEKGAVIVYDTEVRRKADGKSSVIRLAELKVGDYIYIDTNNVFGSESTDVSGLTRIKVMGIMEKVPYGFPYPGRAIGVILTEDTFKSITGASIYSGFDVLIDKNEDRKHIKEQLTTIMNRVRGGSLLDLQEIGQKEKQVRLAVSVLLYGFVAVIVLIGVLNIINTISTNLILRTREFGTLRAVGMSMSQMKKMITYEGLLYGLIGSLWGVSTGTVLAWYLFKIMMGLRGMIWHIPYDAIIYASTGTIIITLLSTLVPMKRVSKMNIIESVGVEE